jgi:hypothetical protein
MHNQNAVRNIISAYHSEQNPKSLLFIKLGLYTIAAVVCILLNTFGFPIAGFVVGFVIVLVTVVKFGLRLWFFEEEFHHEQVPDAVYASIKQSDAIESGLLVQIRKHMSHDMTVRSLIGVEIDYHDWKKTVTSPGYRSLAEDDNIS